MSEAKTHGIWVTAVSENMGREDFKVYVDSPDDAIVAGTIRAMNMGHELPTVTLA